MNANIKTLMAALGCKRYPERWEDFFDETCEKLEKEGNPLYVG